MKVHRAVHRLSRFRSPLRVVVGTILGVLLTTCAPPLDDLNNPYDPASSVSPLGTTASGVTWTIAPGADPGTTELSLTWDPIDAALGYRLQISNSGDYETPEVDLELAEPSWGPESLSTAAEYRARLRYQAQVSYQGTTETVWSPWQDLPPASTDSGEDTPQEDGEEEPAPEDVDGGELTLGQTVTHEFSARGDTVTFQFRAQRSEQYALVIDDEFSGRQDGADPMINIRDESSGTAVYIAAEDTDNRDKVANPLVFQSDLARNIQDGTFEAFMTITIESDNPDTNSFELTIRHAGPLVFGFSFPDPAVQAYVDSVSDATTRVGAIGDLDLLGSSATDLTGIDQLTNLRSIIIGGLGITDLSPLSSLTYLESLNADFASINDISALSGKEFLTSVYVSSTSVTNLSPLSASPLLETVWAFSTGVSDLSPLQDADRLRQLNIEDTNVSDLSPIFSVNTDPPLEQLYANRLGASDDALTTVEGIGSLTTLRRIDLQGNTALTAGVGEIANLPNLTLVDLQGSTSIPAADVTAIEDANVGNTGFRLVRPDGSEFTQ